MTPASPKFQWRALVSVLGAFSFSVIALSGAILFLAPPGRIANWTNWTLIGFRKSEWTAFHIMASVVFLATMAFHVYLNWRPMLGYFQNRVTRTVSLRREWLVAFGLCFLVMAGTKAELPPFSSLMAWSESLKESWDKNETRAPEAHAELLPLNALAQKAGIPVEQAIARLRGQNIMVQSPEETLKQIAERSGKSAQALFAIISAQPATTSTALPVPGTGMGPGRKSLELYCTENGIKLSDALSRLSAKGYKATPEQTLRDIAQANGFDKPYGLIEVIKGAQ